MKPYHQLDNTQQTGRAALGAGALGHPTQSNQNSLGGTDTDLGRGEVHEEMHFLQVSLETADGLSARLINRLSQICSPETPQPEKDCAERPTTAAFAGVISARRREVDELNRRLASILDRLQF